MSIATRQPQPAQKRTLQRLWRTPTSTTRWLWLVCALALYLSIFLWYFYAVKTQQDPEPINDPFRIFSIIAFIMIVSPALEERILEREYTVDRLCAGKSEPLKQYCLTAIEDGASYQPSDHTAMFSAIMPTERRDFQLAVETLTTRLTLVKSLKRQQRAQFIIRAWRTFHIALACLALLVISYHSIMELLANVLHVITPA